MIELYWEDSSAIPKAVEILRSEGGVIMLEVPNIFILLAAPTLAGAEKMEAIKGRPKGKKNFGFCVGYLDSFFTIIEKDELPISMRESSDHLTNFEQSHVNVVVTKDRSFNTIIVRDGTIQGWISAEGSPIREFLKKLEAGLIGFNDIQMLNGKYYSAAIGTSANKSGQETITDWEKAKQFGEEKDIPLIIRFDRDPQQKLGSFSIYQLRNDKIQTMRNGILQQQTKNDENVRNLRVGLVKQLLSDLDMNRGNLPMIQIYQAFNSVEQKVRNGYIDKDEFRQFIQTIQENRDRKVFFLKKANKIKKKDSDLLFNAINFNNDKILSFEEIAKFLNDAHEIEDISPLNDVYQKFLQGFQKIVSVYFYNDGVDDEVEAERNTIDLEVFLKSFSSFDTADTMTVSKKELEGILNANGNQQFTAMEIDMFFSLVDADECGHLELEEIHYYLVNIEECEGINPFSASGSKNKKITRGDADKPNSLTWSFFCCKIR